MKESQRTEVISNIARDVVLKKCPKYAKDKDIVPFIVRDTLDWGPLKGQTSFLVIYPFGTEKERRFYTMGEMESGREVTKEIFSTRIEIVSSSGVWYSITDGDNYVFLNPEIWKGFNFNDK